MTLTETNGSAPNGTGSENKETPPEAATSVPNGNGYAEKDQEIALTPTNSKQMDEEAGMKMGNGESTAVSDTATKAGPVRPFPLTASELGLLSDERNRTQLAQLLARAAEREETTSNQAQSTTDDAVVQKLATEPLEGLTEKLAGMGGSTLQSQITTLAAKIEQDETDRRIPMASQDHGLEEDEHDPIVQEADRHADLAAFVMVTLLLRSSPEKGIDEDEVPLRQEAFGSNALTAKKLDSFLKLCWDAVQDFVLIMLIVLGIISIVVEVVTHIEDGETCSTCWIEGAAILMSVCIVVLVTAGIDYAKQFAFIRLTRSLHESNTKQVIRNGKQMAVTDDEIVVGDILSVNSHNLTTIPADCVLLGPHSDLKMDESALTGESRLVSKKPGDVILSGTNAAQGQGKMVVFAVGSNSMSGKIRARVYETEEAEDEELGDEGENSPLFVKLEDLAKKIGIAGTIAAVVALIGSCIIGLVVEGDDLDKIVDYLVTAITVLAVAVPEGLPLAVTLALAFSSNKMMREQNLVKHLDACETMGCATTICTDKTGASEKNFNLGNVEPLLTVLTNHLLACSSFRHIDCQQNDCSCVIRGRRYGLHMRRPYSHPRKLLAKPGSVGTSH